MADQDCHGIDVTAVSVASENPGGRRFSVMFTTAFCSHSDDSFVFRHAEVLTRRGWHRSQLCVPHAMRHGALLRAVWVAVPHAHVVAVTHPCVEALPRQGRGDAPSSGPQNSRERSRPS